MTSLRDTGTPRTAYSTGGYLANMVLNGKYAYISSYIPTDIENVGYINRINTETLNSELWTTTGTKFVSQMAVNGNYLYLSTVDPTNGDSAILQLSFDDPSNVVTWYTSDEPLVGIAVSGGIIYASTPFSILTLSTLTSYPTYQFTYAAIAQGLWSTTIYGGKAGCNNLKPNVTLNGVTLETGTDVSDELTNIRVVTLSIKEWLSLYSPTIYNGTNHLTIKPIQSTNTYYTFNIPTTGTDEWTVTFDDDGLGSDALFYIYNPGDLILRNINFELYGDATQTNIYVICDGTVSFRSSSDYYGNFIANGFDLNPVSELLSVTLYGTASALGTTPNVDGSGYIAMPVQGLDLNRLTIQYPDDLPQAIRKREASPVNITVVYGGHPINQLAINGYYLYAAINTGVARLSLVDNTFTQGWLNNTLKTISVTAYGDYLYASVINGTNIYHIMQIPVDDPTSYSWFDTTVSNLYYLYANSGYLYAPLILSTVRFVLPQLSDTLVYSQAELTASSTDTAMGKRGTALLRRPGKRKPVAIIEMFTRTSMTRHGRRGYYTTHLNSTITFFNHISAISCHHVYVTVGNANMSKVASCNVTDTNGLYDGAKVTITPNGRMRHVKFYRFIAQ